LPSPPSPSTAVGRTAETLTGDRVCTVFLVGRCVVGLQYSAGGVSGWLTYEQGRGGKLGDGICGDGSMD
jgi:hypothetical protein